MEQYHWTSENWNQQVNAFKNKDVIYSKKQIKSIHNNRSLCYNIFVVFIRFLSTMGVVGLFL